MNPLFIRRLSIDREALPAGSYLRGLAAVRRGSLAFHRPVTFFVGENGTGKSTLMEAIAVAFGLNPEGGSRSFRFSTRDTHSPLYRALTLEKNPLTPRDAFFLRAESLYNAATYIEELDANPRDGSPPIIGAYGGKSLHEQSHGESFLALVQNRFHGGGLYLLDEPEAALSPIGQMTLLARIHALAGQGAQFLIATHSPLLITCPDSEVYEFLGSGPRLTPYQETAHYQVVRGFLNKPEETLRVLLGEP
ncbi:MAG TPA: AAA family ATPase [Firmicutes bacterium]|nr:AAA family ATPase [Bacillota bacterium]